MHRGYPQSVSSTGRMHASKSFETLLTFDSGHYDMIYKDSQPLQVYHQREHITPQGIMTSNQPSDNADLQYLFPDALSYQTPLMTGSSYTTSGTSNQQHQQSYVANNFGHGISATYTNNQASHAVTSQRTTASTYPHKLQLPTSRSTMSPSPMSQKALHQSSKKKEPQIRLNENCYNYKLGRHESIPLSPESFGR